MVLDLRPIILNPKKYWKIISSATKIETKAAERKKYLNFKISNLHKRCIINNIKKNLKKDMDLTNLIKFSYSYSSKYKDFIKFKLVEKKTTKKNKKIIFNVKSNLTFKIFDFK